MGKARIEALTIPQVAERLQVSDRTVWRELHRGHLRGIRFGRKWRILETDLEEYLNANASIPAAQ